MEWYYTQNDTQCGPVTQGQLAEMIRNRTVLPRELAWREGLQDWQIIEGIDTFKRFIPPPTIAALAPLDYPQPQTQSGIKRPLDNPYQQPVTRRPQQMNNGMVLAIISAVCSLIPGIIAIAYASQVNGFFARGDYERAEKSAKTAKMWIWIAFGWGLLKVFFFTVSA